MAVRIESFYIDLGRRIQTLREERLLTQEKLGRMLHPSMTRASVANIEGGKQRVLAHTLVSIASALKIALGDLIPPAPFRTAQRSGSSLKGELADKLDLSPRKLGALFAKLSVPAKESK